MLFAEMMLRPKHQVLHWIQSQSSLIFNIKIKEIYCFDLKLNKKKPEKKQRHFYIKQRTIHQTEWKYTALGVLNTTTMVILGHTISPSTLFFIPYHIWACQYLVLQPQLQGDFRHLWTVEILSILLPWF